MKDKKIITQQAIEELESLFSFTPPDRLQQNIKYIFFQFLIKTDIDILPIDFQQIAMDIHYLLDFLQTIKEGQKE